MVPLRIKLEKFSKTTALFFRTKVLLSLGSQLAIIVRGIKLGCL